MLAYPQRGIGFQPVFCYPKVFRIVRWTTSTIHPCWPETHVTHNMAAAEAA